MATEPHEAVSPVGAGVQYVLVGEVSQHAPPYKDNFMATGGSLDAAAAPGDTDFALTGASESLCTTLHGSGRDTHIRLPIPTSQIVGEHAGIAAGGKPGILVAGEAGGEHVPATAAPMLHLAADTRINISTSRMATAVNGTMGTSVAGEGSVHLYDLLKQGGHGQVGMAYGSWLAHAACVAIHNARVLRVDAATGAETTADVTFVARPAEVSSAVQNADGLLQQYVDAALQMREHIKYAPSPMLTKTVFCAPVGIAGNGYSMLHDILVRDSPIGTAALESLYKATIANDLLHDSETLDAFMRDTKAPGLTAARCARTVASATNLAVNYLMAYRADGRNVIGTNGADFAVAENWQAAAARDGKTLNDCDGSALLAISLLQHASEIGADAAAEYPHLNAVKNAMFPYYQRGIAIVGATSAEASHVGDAASPVAGHAVAVLIPTMQLLHSLSKAMPMKVGATKQTVAPVKTRALVEEARFAALFPSHVMEQIGLPADERSRTQTYHVAKHSLEPLMPYAIDGTAPMSVQMHLLDDTRRASAAVSARMDEAGFRRVGPSVFRAVKALHTGPNDVHMFYKDFVELTLPRTSPLYTNRAIRMHNAAATQFVFASDARCDGVHVAAAGATPRDMASGEYALVPMVCMNAETSDVLDVASELAAKDIMPPRRRQPSKLSPFETGCLKASLAHLQRLDAHWAAETNKSAKEHVVSYEVAYSTLVHNPKGVAAFVDAVSRVSGSGHIDKLRIRDFATDANKEDAGWYVSVNASVQI